MFMNRERKAVDLAPYRGCTITTAEEVEQRYVEGIRLTFEDGRQLFIYDDGQSCCEHRYMTFDDPLSELVGASFNDVQESFCNNEPDDDYGDAHEMVFLNIVTDRGVVQVVNHNKHNGYYGGFSIKIDEGKAK